MTKDEIMLIMQIAAKAENKGLLLFDRISLILDIEAVHKEVGLGLNDLLNADDANFAHDIVGIQQNIDRSSKKLMNCFLPRYARG